MRFLISFLVLVRVAVSGVDPCTQTTPLTPTSTVISEVVSGPGNNGYWYEVWTNSPGGPSNITLYEEGAAFFAEWSEPDDFLGRVGQRWPAPGGVRSGELYPEYGNMVAEYAYTRSAQKTAGDRYNFIGVYGWAYDNVAKGIPLVEYYIIDDWFGNLELNETEELPESTACHDAPADWVCQKGSFNVDGANYKIYTNWRVNKPSIIGDTTFLQYFSVREHTKYRKCGKITISEHFKKWNSLNLRMGVLFEASLLVEVQKGVGFVDYTHAEVFLNVSDGDLGFTPGVYAPACYDRAPSSGSCGDPLDASDVLAPDCYVQPDNNKCDTTCPIDYEPGTGANIGKCVLKAYTDPQCLARAVQRSGCKDGAYADASCAQFGCGPSCFLNSKHTKCSLNCDTGEVPAGGSGKYCEVPCSDRNPRPVTLASSSHSMSNAAVNYDVIISVEEVLFKFGYKLDSSLKIIINGVSKTSVNKSTNDVLFPVDEEFKWSGITQDKLANVAVSVEAPAYTIAAGTIDISDIVFKVDSITEGVEDTFTKYDPDPNNHYSTTFTVKYKVAVIGNSAEPNWRCSLPTQTPVCYLEGSTCVSACTDPANILDEDTGSCVLGPPDDDQAYTHAVRWGGWALCLLIVVLFL